MSASLDEAARAAAVDFARLMAAYCQRQFGPRLLGAYLIGSLAHGMFSRRYSDIDFAVVTENGLEPPEIAAIHAVAAACSPELAAKLSLFWTDRTFWLGRFPPLDRVDYHDFAVVLVERERVVPARPTIEDIRAYLGHAPLVNWDNNARRFAAMATLEPKDHKLYIRAHLYPARLIYSWATGRMASNDEAVAFVQRKHPPGLDVGLIGQALSLRHAAVDPDPIFPARVVLPKQVEATRHYVAASA